MNARDRLAMWNADQDRRRAAALRPGLASDARPHVRRAKPGVTPSAALNALYRRALVKLIREMQGSVDYWLRAAYRENEPAIAADALPAREMASAAKTLRQRWQSKFDDASERLAKWFAKKSWNRSEEQLKKILRDGGMSVKFQMTEGMRDVFAATVEENVALIKSIPAQYFDQIEGLVQRSVAGGRDLSTLSTQLRKRYGVTTRRAALIARDQNNKATSMLSNARQRELGIEQAVWIHSHAGKEPRPSHVRMDGKKFDLAKGMWDEDEGRYVLPGELINCRCISRPVIAEFSA